ncbi:MAG: lipocalin family protein [Rhodanobacteraceae bacterium]
MRFSRILFACAATAVSATVCAGHLPPIQPVEQVELPRFMGQWYVIAAIPTPFAKNTYNAVETYTLQPDGRVRATFGYLKGGFDGRPGAFHSTGSIQPGTGNAIWGMQFIWPLKAEYIVAYLNDDYSETIIARNKRDYVWIMARTRTIPQGDYDGLLDRIKQMGYSLSDLRKVPQQWPASSQ